MNYFWRSWFIFKLIETCILPRSEKNERNLKKVSVSEKKILLRYRNWTLVSVPDTESWFGSTLYLWPNLINTIMLYIPIGRSIVWNVLQMSIKLENSNIDNIAFISRWKRWSIQLVEKPDPNKKQSVSNTYFNEFFFSLEISVIGPFFSSDSGFWKIITLQILKWLLTLSNLTQISFLLDWLNMKH